MKIENEWHDRMEECERDEYKTKRVTRLIIKDLVTSTFGISPDAADSVSDDFITQAEELDMFKGGDMKHFRPLYDAMAVLGIRL